MPTPSGEGPHQNGWNNGVTTALDPMSGERQAQGRVNQITSNTKSTMMITRFSKSDMLHLNLSFSARSPLQGEIPAGSESQSGQVDAALGTRS